MSKQDIEQYLKNNQLNILNKCKKVNELEFKELNSLVLIHIWECQEQYIGNPDNFGEEIDKIIKYSNVNLNERERNHQENRRITSKIEQEYFEECSL